MAAETPLNHLTRLLIMYLVSLTGGLVRGAAVSTWGMDVLGALAEDHAKALAIGRAAAQGDERYTVTEMDTLGGTAIAAGEGTYLSRFADDIRNGRYGAVDDLSTAAIDARIALYAAKLRGTATEAFVRASKPGDTFRWNLGASEHHCSECPEYDGGIYTAETLPAIPGDGTTECGTNCKCSLTRISDGMTAFAEGG
jgi:hypothetical protein